MNAALASIRDAKTILLTTYKRDGTPVATPVSVAFDGERAFLRSYELVPSEPKPGCHPGRTGGPWLCRTFVRSLFHAVVVPSGFRTTVQPHWWITTW
jgi:hypothetical protein